MVGLIEFVRVPVQERGFQARNPRNLERQKWAFDSAPATVYSGEASAVPSLSRAHHFVTTCMQHAVPADKLLLLGVTNVRQDLEIDIIDNIYNITTVSSPKVQMQFY